MIQFYAPDIAADLSLPADEAAHCVRVLRKKSGDEIIAVDGKGVRYTCRLTEATNHRAAVEIISRETVIPAWNGQLVVAVAPTKNMDRMEWLVEKLTEVGFNRFIPLECDHSERRVIKPERLEKIAISAMKQSLKATMPQIDTITPFAHIVNGFSKFDRYIAYCDRTIPRRLFAEEFRPGHDTLLLIGPEGDFSQPEIRSALESGFIPVTLGPSRLRTETAALYGVIAAQAANSIANSSKI